MHHVRRFRRSRSKLIIYLVKHLLDIFVPERRTRPKQVAVNVSGYASLFLLCGRISGGVLNRGRLRFKSGLMGGERALYSRSPAGRGVTSWPHRLDAVIDEP